AGAGPLDGKTRFGALLHDLHAFAPDGTPLGTVYAVAWTRDEHAVRSRSLSRAERAAMPIEQKESYRWVQSLQRAGEEANRCRNTKFVCIADSEADIYEVLVEGTAQPWNASWILR